MDRPGNDATPFQVPAPVDVSATGYRHRQSEALCVRTRDKVGTRLRCRIWMFRSKCHVFDVRRAAVVAISLVGRRHDDTLNALSAADGIEERPGAADVVVECLRRI